MNLRRLFFGLFLFSLLSVHAQSQRDSIAIYGKVMDSFTHEMLKGVKVEVLRPDSSLVSQHNTDNVYGYGDYRYNFGVLGERGVYVLRADYIFSFFQGRLRHTVCQSLQTRLRTQRTAQIGRRNPTEEDW